MSRRGIALVLAGVLFISSCGDDATAPDMEWEVAHTSTDWWMSVYAAAPADRWIAGGTTTDGKILRFDGETISEVGHGAAVGLLNWIHGFPSGEVVAVGNEGAVVRWDGSTWSADEPVTDQDLWGVWGAEPGDLWAVGGDASGGTATVLRDSGQGFQPVPIPALERPGVDVFFKVWGSGPDDVYIVGQNGAVLHWDGTVLEELLVGVSLDLIGVWGTGPDRVVTVGGRTNGAAAVWDGSEWHNPDLGRLPGINGVWIDGSTAYIVGDRGATGTIDLETLEVSVSLSDVPISIHAVQGSGNIITAVGGDFTTGPQGPFLGQVLTAER